MTQFEEICLDYTEQLKKYEIWELSIELKALAESRLRALENFAEFDLQEYKLDLQLQNQYIFICAAEIMRRQIP